MKQIQNAVMAHLQAQIGIPAVADRSRCRVYPLLAVSVREGDTVLLAGGKLAEHIYEVEIQAFSDRERDEESALLDALVPPLLRGVPMGDRMLHPEHIRTEEERLRFSLTVCRTVPVPEDAAEPVSPGMTHLTFTL